MLVAIAVSAVVSKFDLLMPVVWFLHRDAPEASQRIVARIAEVAVWLSVPLTVAFHLDVEAMAAGGLPAVFIGVLVRKPLRNYLTGFVNAVTVAANDRLHPGVRVKFHAPGVEGVITDIDTDEIHVELDNGNVTHVPHKAVVGERWTTIAGDG
jgi:hypothetical protein